MINISRKLVTYNTIELPINVTHYILIAEHVDKKILLSHPNLFLYSRTRSSEHTSKRYASIISMFYRFLSTQEKMQGHDISSYHLLADNRDIRRWQIQRQLDRLEKQSARPCSETIYEDAKLLLGFFHWLNQENFLTNVSVKLKSWKANFRSRRLLSYIQTMSKTKIDAENIRVLDKRNRQTKFDFLVTKPEIEALLRSYVDPVYQCLFNFALGTGMRPMDICRYPYLGDRDNKHIMPFSEMGSDSNVTTEYTVYDSKGHKDRTIIIHMEDLRAIEENYIKPYYMERRKLYKQHFGHDCPPGILFLNKNGIPVTPIKIAKRTNSAKVKAMASMPSFRSHIDFYQTRHWWPTQYLIVTFGEALLTESTDVLVLAAAQVITNQLGHNDIEITYKHYIDMARVMMATHKGLALDLINNPKHTVQNFTALLNRPVSVSSDEGEDDEN